MDRTALGNTFAQRLQQLHGKDAVIVCLQESSLLTCLTMAGQLRAWVYPLLYIPIYTPDGAHQLFGAFDQEGEFCALPGGPADKKEIPDSITTAIQDQKSAALKLLRDQKARYGITFDEHRLDGRDVILTGDIVTGILPVVMAQQLLKKVRPRSLTAIAGNATPEAAQLIRVSAGHAEVLDVLNSIVFDDDRYFEHADEYTLDQKYTLTQHIAAYWQ